MNFKCNFCERKIPYEKLGKPKIKCFCGATYTKTLIIQITQDDD